MNQQLSKGAKLVLNYLKKNDLNVQMRWSYGIQVHRVIKDGKELSYPRINEDISCEISPYLEAIAGTHQTGLTYKLKQ